MLASALVVLLAAAPLPPPAEQELAREIFKELIEIDTTQDLERAEAQVDW